MQLQGGRWEICKVSGNEEAPLNPLLNNISDHGPCFQIKLMSYEEETWLPD